MNKQKKLFALLFTLALLLGILPFAPQSAYAASALNTGCYVYFGKYSGVPILWKVTDVSDGNADLLSEYVLYHDLYHDSNLFSAAPDLTFSTSDLYSRLNSSTFKTNGNVFTVAEQGAIVGDITLPDINIGPSYNRDGSIGHYWLSKNPIKIERSGDFYWIASYVHHPDNETEAEFYFGLGVRPVLKINLSSGIFNSGFSVPAITNVSNIDTTGHRAGETRDQNLEIMVSGESAFAGNVARVTLTSGANTIKKDYVLQAADFTEGAFTNLAVAIPPASFDGKPAGSYTVTATLINMAGSHEVPLSTGTTADNYPIAPRNDASLLSVAGKTISAGSEPGSQAAPKTASVSVTSDVSSIVNADLTAATGATAALYSGSDFVTPQSPAQLNVGDNHLYIKVTAEDNATILYYDVTVNRAAPTYTLTVTNGTGGGAYTAGTQVPIQADIAPSGKVFDQWTSGSGGTFAHADSADTAFVMPGNAVTVTATYKDIVIPSELPATGQNSTWSWMLGALALLCGGAAALTVRKVRRNTYF